MVPDWKTKGKRRSISDSFGDAIRGLLFAVKTERNMRIHLTAALYVLFFAPFLKVSRGEYAALILAIALVITAEGFNTAIEMLCYYAQKSYNPLIGKTKYIASGA
ncbi:MAG: diacylglycerol kinase family protein, partial [Clostridia bacterium]|nr:diacylglycerol kinase family protein [Clostridia bacterium]